MSNLFHDVANIFPMMTPEEYQALKEDIAANGLIEPIWFHNGQIIDGRNRWNACTELGIEPTIREYTGPNLVQFVVSLNLNRRHLDSSQKAIVALNVLPMLEAEAKERQIANLKQGDKMPVVEIIPQREEEPTAKSRDVAAAIVGTNPRYVSDAKRIQAEAPELIPKIAAGELSIPAAKRLINPPHVSYNSGENEWYTPSDIVEAARIVLVEIDVDPASSHIANKTIKAKIFYTKEDDGIKKNWFGNIWMNPPYSQPEIKYFSDKIVDEYVSGRVKSACVLVNNATETKWFNKMLSNCSAVCFPVGRIKFIDQNGNQSGAPLQGQAIIYFGNNETLFKQNFEEFGPVLCAVK